MQEVRCRERADLVVLSLHRLCPIRREVPQNRLSPVASGQHTHRLLPQAEASLLTRRRPWAA